LENKRPIQYKKISMTKALPITRGKKIAKKVGYSRVLARFDFSCNL